VDEDFETHERVPSPVSAKALHRKNLHVLPQCTALLMAKSFMLSVRSRI
jgi:hypothetical protein